MKYKPCLLLNPPDHSEILSVSLVKSIPNGAVSMLMVTKVWGLDYSGRVRERETKLDFN